MIPKLWTQKNDFISIIGAYNLDNTIFDNMVLPSFEKDGSVYSVNKEETVFRIFEKCSELELLFTDTDYIKKSVYFWSDRHLTKWNRLYKALEEQYNPLWNKDGEVLETNTETRNLSNVSALSGKDTQTTAGEEKTEYGGTNESKVSAFNSSEYAPKDKTESGGEDKQSRDGTTETEYGRTDTVTNTGTVTYSTSKIERGNIGVTMTQELLKAEMSIVNYNIVDVIAEDFKREYCLTIY